ncbi:MAG: DsbE family thiol:disulfide interchange protein [Pseudomonadota bacterium]
MNRLVFILPLTAFVALLAYFAIGLQRDPSAIPSVLIDKPAPQFDLPAIDGRETGLSTVDLKGEVSLVNFFGSWCVSCRIEHPLLMQLSQAGEIPIYGIDWKDPPGAGTAWLERHGDPYTKIGDDADGRVAIDFGITGAPETFIIDRNARIRYKYAGPITPQIWEEDLAPIIQQLRNEE